LPGATTKYVKQKEKYCQKKSVNEFAMPFVSTWLLYQKRRARILARTTVAKSLDPSCFTSITTNNVREFLQYINCG